MKTKTPILKPFALVAGALICCALHLPAQPAPTITTQPTNQTVMPGTKVTCNVTVEGTGPFTYQWQLNGTNLPNNLITTVAGGGFGGHDNVATYAALHDPCGVAVNAGGNLYIADSGDRIICKVDTNGIISIVAGRSFVPGYSGDSGPAVEALLVGPGGMVFDAFGDYYIADFNANRIRRVDTNGIITTVAGNGGTNYAGDGGPATNASLYNPADVALDAGGNLYIAEAGDNRIRRVGTNGIITTVAGNGIATNAGDGGPATNASLNSPYGVAVDAGGNLYIADCFNNSIRKVDTNGIISTVAGNGTNGYSGDEGIATNASLNYPCGMALDAFGNLYIADEGNSRIRKMDTNGIITTVAGTNSAGYSGDGGAPANASLCYPMAVAFDAGGNLYIADGLNNRIREVWLYAASPYLTLSPVGARNAGDYTVVISNAYGSVTSAVATLTVQAPPSITLQPTNQSAPPGTSPAFSVTAVGTGPFDYLWYLNGSNLVQSGANSTLTLPGVSPIQGGNYSAVVTNAYGSVTSQVAALAVLAAPVVISQPASQTVLAGANATLSLAIANTGPCTFQWRFNGTNLPNNIITTVAGTNGAGYSGNGGAAINAMLNNPCGVALDAAGNVYIADASNMCIRKVDTKGIITTFAGTNSGGYSGDGGAGINAKLNYPSGVALDSAGNVYIADASNMCIRKVDTKGIITTFAGTNSRGYSGDGGAAINAKLNNPSGVALDSAGNVYIADSSNNRIRKVGTDGIINTVAGTNGAGYSGNGGVATKAQLYSPEGMALDAFGNMFIADSVNNRIRKVDTNGIITTVAGTAVSGYSGDGGAAANATLNGPVSVAVDSSGNLFIADTSNQRIREVDTNGIITTVAGTNSAGYSGDGGAPTNAGINRPFGVAVDPSGDLYVADSGNQRIRKVWFYAGYPTLTLSNVGTNNAGNYTVVISNAYGSVTSAVVALNVAMTRPQILASDVSFGFVTNQFGFNLSGDGGQTVVVDGSADLVNWTPLFTNTATGGSPYYFCDPCWTNYPLRFYRARLP